MYRLLKKLLALWIRFDNQAGASLPELNTRHPVIYVLRRESTSDSLAADLFLARHRLPALHAEADHRPLVALELKQRHQRRLKRRQEPTPLVKLCQQVHADSTLDYQLVPISVFWGRSPNKESSLFRILFSDRWSIPGPVRKFFTVLFNGRATFVEVNAPLSLRELMQNTASVERTSRKAHRVLRVHFNRVRHRVLGPDLSHRRTLLTQIVHSPPVRQAITQHARTQKSTLEKSRQKAVIYLEEIMADISYPTVRVLDIFLSWLWNRIYNGVKVHNIDMIKEAAQDNAIVYVPCHRSHIDYLLLSYCLYHQGLSLPHIAAGKNLNMPIVGPVLRRGGAFFMRRSFRGDKLYTAVFNEYLYQMFSRGFPVEYFVEGGRSRTGRTLTPKAGMLSMTVRSFARGHEDGNQLPMKFVPVYIGYEKVFEANSYLKELRGRSKKNESVFGLLRTVRRLKNYGTVHLNFGSPIDLQHLVDETAPNWRAELDSEDKPAWINPVVQQLCQQVAQGINRAAALNPVNLLAMVLLSSPRNAQDRQSLIQQLTLYCDILRRVPYSQEMSFPPGEPTDWLDHAIHMKVVEKIEQPLGDIYALNDHQAVLMTYYRNNILHLFAVPALICCSLQVHGTSKTRESMHKQLALIYPYVRNELFLHWPVDEAVAHGNDYIEALIDLGLIVEADGHLQATSEPDLLVHFMELGRLMTPTLERYYLTLATLDASGQSSLSGAQLESRAQEVAQLVSVLNGLNAPEFFDKSLFKQFVQTLRERTVIQTDADNRIQFDHRVHDAMKAAESLLSPELVRNVHWITSQWRTRD
ncbi:glycerol-3-phosphate 1-O-acyltransferase PlsB [Natronospirillum operosum]|uniref:Glycerol-3-phosphate acyltransferase n=1 Tax=Natronospirillum operosum TaxID=2759953 RepID=A0A4Z0WCN8_9GAMM|nr:glycerol-3-phosphate 1-O-acyltransferase PlsB [Natronospirillum operosum]TGG92760.1 glycerol-3-phosphate 1-O-acyltransferase PlsB [Natronospirillum operosum]